MISILDLFRIGIGPSSSHTVGPMRITFRFAEDLEARGILRSVTRLHVQLQGSLALTGVGHGSIDACLMGLLGGEPETVDPGKMSVELEAARTGALRLLGRHLVAFDLTRDLELATTVTPDLHPNGMVERFYRCLKDALRARCAAANWTDHLPWVLMGLRAAPREDDGSTPAQEVFTYQ